MLFFGSLRLQPECHELMEKFLWIRNTCNKWKASSVLRFRISYCNFSLFHFSLLKPLIKAGFLYTMTSECRKQKTYSSSVRWCANPDFLCTHTSLQSDANAYRQPGTVPRTRTMRTLPASTRVIKCVTSILAPQCPDAWRSTTISVVLVAIDSSPLLEII